MRVTVEVFDSGSGEGRARKIYCDWNEIPLGMPNEKCALFMLGKAKDKIEAKLPQPLKRHD